MAEKKEKSTKPPFVRYTQRKDREPFSPPAPTVVVPKNIARKSDLVSAEVMPEGFVGHRLTKSGTISTSVDKPCRASGGAKSKAADKAAGALKTRACHLELVFVGAEGAARLKEKYGSTVEPGAYLRACSRTVGKPGALVPVKDADHSAEVAATICDCVAESGGSKTAIDCVRAGAPLGRLAAGGFGALAGFLR